MYSTFPDSNGSFFARLPHWAVVAMVAVPVALLLWYVQPRGLGQEQEWIDDLMLGSSRDFESAIAALDRMIDRARDNRMLAGMLPHLHAMRGMRLLNDKQQPEQALADFDAALRLDPDHWMAHRGRAAYFLQRGDTTRAEAETKLAEELAKKLAATTAEVDDEAD